MRQITIIILFLLSLSAIGLSQGIVDSIFVLPSATVRSERNFEKESAGMKFVKIDTLILAQKINLSLSDLLSENTPVFIKNHGRGALSTASFRGTAPSHTKVVWNGLQISNPMAGMVDFSLIPIYVIDDISLNYGTASIIDGSGGLGGSVSISNTANWNDKFNLKYLQSVGSFNSFDEYLCVGAAWKKISIRTRIYHSYSENDFTFINRGIGEIDAETGEIVNPIDTNFNADYKKYGILQEIYFRPNHNNQLSVKYWGQYSDRTIPRATSYEGPDNSNLNSQQDTDHKLVLGWNRFKENSKLSVLGGYSTKNLIYSLMNNISGLGLYPAIYSISKNQTYSGDIKYSYELSNKFVVSAGTNMNFNSVRSEDTVGRTGYEKERSELSSFITLSLNPINRLNLNLILRQNLVDFKFIPLIPFFGIDYKIFKDHDLILKANVAKNYNIPSLHDLYWQPGGNPDLLPEEGLSCETGIEYLKKSEKISFSSELAAFHSNVKNWILWVPSFRGYWEPRNIEKVISQGFEINAKLDFKINLFRFSFIGSYSLTSSKNYGNPLVWGDESYGKQLVYVPLHSGNILGRVMYKGLYLSYQHNSYSERFTTSTNDVSRRDWLYPYFMNDLIFGWLNEFDKMNFSAEIKVYNLFNETYHSVLYRPMPGRNFVLSLMFEF
ncbi:MAG: TonB-dependent receptor plug domain-containing protein [Bacteroidales bacterium]|nr:TonB-dependent receptor plug domain-containing protein [Bacteroidales bacterium]